VAGKGGSCCDGGSAAVLLLCYVFLPLYVSVLLLLSLLLLLLRSLTMVELLSLAVLLGTKQNDGGTASNGGGRETREREMSYCSSPLFFCFSVLSFYSLVSSSLPLSVCLSNNPLLRSLYSVLFFKFISHKFCPSGFLFFFSSPLTFVLCSFSKILPPLFGFLPSGFYRQAERESSLPCSIMHGA